MMSLLELSTRKNSETSSVDLNCVLLRNEQYFVRFVVRIIRDIGYISKLVYSQFDSIPLKDYKVNLHAVPSVMTFLLFLFFCGGG